MQIANPPTCPADLGKECSDSGEWEGEFFPGIPKIKYEVGIVLSHLSESCKICFIF
jgi:hypothetical protein